MPAVAVMVWQSTLLVLLPGCSPSVAYSGGCIAWREKERVGDRPRSGPMSWETDSLTNYPLITMQYCLRDLQNVQFIGKEEQFEN